MGDVWWQPMSTAPKNNEDILVIDEDYERVVVSWYPHAMAWLDRSSITCKPRCWHPLPEALSYEEVEAIGK